MVGPLSAMSGSGLFFGYSPKINIQFINFKKGVKVMLDFILMNKAIFIVFGTMAVLAAFMFILTEWSRRDAMKNEKDKSIENPEREVRVK